ncbi:hypothetical protein DMUE_1065 [Dictyocoela muelleri]|nr:hypothetical protein DMUE_1065 [Dictyocoela muelleri]
MKIPVDYDEIINKLRLKTQIFNNKMKVKRKNVTYNEGDMIYLKNFSTDKVQSKWLGPYKVVRLSNSKNNIYINKGNKVIRASIKHVRLFKGGEDVASLSVATILIKNDEDECLPNYPEIDQIVKNNPIEL